MTDPTILVHRIELARGLDGATVRQLFIRCPYCGREHCHGGGDVAGPVIDGHRVSHCHQGGYYLQVEASS